MSNYASILRGSRLMALPPTIKSVSAHLYHPTQPAIRSTKANQAIGDWGLKRSLPRLRTQNITISDIDTQEHQTPFKSSNAHTKVVQRWQEMGIPITVRNEAQTFSENLERSRGRTHKVNKGIYIPTMPRAAAKRFIGKVGALRSSFQAANKIDKDIVYSKEQRLAVKAMAQKYFDINSTSSTYTVQTNGGLGYHPQGSLSLFSTPNGPQERQLVARILKNDRNSMSLGLGGIVSTLSNNYISEASQLNDSKTRAQGRAATVNVYPQSVGFETNGSIKIKLDAARHNAFDKHKRSTRAFEDSYNFESLFGDEDLTDNDMETPQRLIGRSGARAPSALFELIKKSPVGLGRKS